MKVRRSLVLLAGLAACIGVARADGSVDVSFVQPEHFADAGSFGHDREKNLKTLSDYLQRLGHERLATGQVLKLEVLDVELAGIERHYVRGDVRIMRGAADWPRVTVRYSLQADGRVVQSGEESITDMDYLRRLPIVATSESLAYEKRMLGDWFERRFSTPAAAKS